MVVTNGGFEAGDLSGWTSYTEDNGATVPVIETTTKRTGDYSCKIKSNSGYGICQIYQEIGPCNLDDTISFYHYVSQLIDDLSYLKYRVYDDSISFSPEWISVSNRSANWIQETGTLATLFGLSESAPELVLVIGTFASDGGGITAMIDDVVLTPGIHASFSTDVSSGEPPLTVQFTDTSTNSPTTWSWEFDDGSAAATTQNPSHIFAADGTYHVVLTATGPGGAKVSDPVTITVALLPPVASFTHAVSGDTVRFTDTSGEQPTSWLWDFGDGTTSTEQNPVHRFPKTGGA